MARTVIDIQDDLLREVQAITGIRKKVDVVNFALRRLLEQKELEQILALRGKVSWEGDLEAMRRDRRGPR